MNLVLLFEKDFVSPTQVCLSDHRYQHIKQVLRAQAGDQLSVGLINDRIGTGQITSVTNASVVIDVALSLTPPPPSPLHLILALPRPKMFKRILQSCTSLGVKKITLINSCRVDKSYWQSPVLHAESIRQQFILGLEQAKDTVLPELTLEKRFKPFVQDRLPELCKHTLSFVAHPGTSTACPQALKQATTLVVGPEGGFIPYEIEQLEQAGCQAIHLGQRILKVETAIPFLLAKLLCQF